MSELIRVKTHREKRSVLCCPLLERPGNTATDNQKFNTGHGKHEQQQNTTDNYPQDQHHLWHYIEHFLIKTQLSAVHESNNSYHTTD